MRLSALLLLGCCSAAATLASALLLPTSPPSSPPQQQPTPKHQALNGLWRSLGLLGTAASITLLPGALPAPAATGAAGLEQINTFLTSVRSVKETLQSDAATDLKAVQRALDVEAVTTSVDATLDAQFGRMDQTSIIAKRKVGFEVGLLGSRRRIRLSFDWPGT